MPAPGQSSPQDTITAQVFLRSASGRSLQELAGAADPGDLAQYRAPAGARAAAIVRFEALGFRVFEDQLGIILSIEAPASVFTKVFDVSDARLRQASVVDALRLRVPAGLGDTVEDIMLLPPPEMHGGAG